MKRSSFSPQMAEVLNDSIFYMIVNNMRPKSMVEDEGVKQSLK